MQYCAQVEHLHAQVAPDMPIGAFVSAINPQALGFQSRDQLYAPVEFAVQIAGPLNGAAGAIRVKVPVHANPNWLPVMKHRFAAMIGGAVQAQSLDFRTVDGRSISTVPVEQLHRVGKLHVFVQDKELRLPQVPAIPIEYSVTKMRDIDRWITDTVEDKLPALVARYLAPCKNAEELQAAVRGDGPLVKAIEGAIQGADRVAWAEFVRTRHVNAPMVMPAEEANRAAHAIASDVLLGEVRRMVEAAAPQIKQHFHQVESARIAKELTGRQNPDHYAPIAGLSAAAPPTQGDAIENIHEFYRDLAEDIVTTPHVREAISAVLYTRPMTAIGCRWMLRQGPGGGSASAGTTTTVGGGGSPADAVGGGGGLGKTTAGIQARIKYSGTYDVLRIPNLQQQLANLLELAIKDIQVIGSHKGSLIVDYFVTVDANILTDIAQKIKNLPSQGGDVETTEVLAQGSAITLSTPFPSFKSADAGAKPTDAIGSWTALEKAFSTTKNKDDVVRAIQSVYSFTPNPKGDKTTEDDAINTAIAKELPNFLKSDDANLLRVSELFDDQTISAIPKAERGVLSSVLGTVIRVWSDADLTVYTIASRFRHQRIRDTYAPFQLELRQKRDMHSLIDFLNQNKVTGTESDQISVLSFQTPDITKTGDWENIAALFDERKVPPPKPSGGYFSSASKKDYIDVIIKRKMAVDAGLKIADLLVTEAKSTAQLNVKALAMHKTLNGKKISDLYASQTQLETIYIGLGLQVTGAALPDIKGLENKIQEKIDTEHSNASAAARAAAENLAQMQLQTQEEKQVTQTLTQQTNTIIAEMDKGVEKATIAKERADQAGSGISDSATLTAVKSAETKFNQVTGLKSEFLKAMALAHDKLDRAGSASNLADIQSANAEADQHIQTANSYAAQVNTLANEIETAAANAEAAAAAAAASQSQVAISTPGVPYTWSQARYDVYAKFTTAQEYWKEIRDQWLTLNGNVIEWKNLTDDQKRTEILSMIRAMHKSASSSLNNLWSAPLNAPEEVKLLNRPANWESLTGKQFNQKGLLDVIRKEAKTLFNYNTNTDLVELLTNLKKLLDDATQVRMASSIQAHHPWNAMIHHNAQPAMGGAYPSYYNAMHTKQDMTTQAPYIGDAADTYRAYHLFGGVPVAPLGGLERIGCHVGRHRKHCKKMGKVFAKIHKNARVADQEDRDVDIDRDSDAFRKQVRGNFGVNSELPPLVPLVRAPVGSSSSKAPPVVPISSKAPPVRPLGDDLPPLVPLVRAPSSSKAPPVLPIDCHMSDSDSDNEKLMKDDISHADMLLGDAVDLDAESPRHVGVSIDSRRTLPSSLNMPPLVPIGKKAPAVLPIDGNVSASDDDDDLYVEGNISRAQMLLGSMFDDDHDDFVPVRAAVASRVIPPCPPTIALIEAEEDDNPFGMPTLAQALAKKK